MNRPLPPDLRAFASSLTILAAAALVGCGTDVNGVHVADGDGAVGAAAEALVGRESPDRPEAPPTPSAAAIAPLPTPIATPAAAEARARIAARVARLFREPDRRSLSEVGPTGPAASAFAQLSAEELLQHFADAQTVAGIDRAALLEAARQAAPADVSRAQSDSLVALAQSSAVPLGVTWDPRLKSPRAIAGVFAVSRDEDPASLAQRVMDSLWPKVAITLGADAHDRIEAVDSAVLPDSTFLLTLQRLRNGHGFPQDFVEVAVSGAASESGPGVVGAVVAQWHRDVVSARSVVDAQQARLLLDDAAGTQVEMDPSWEFHCFAGPESDRCVPVWHGRVAADGTRDSASYWLDATTGELLLRESDRLDGFSGSLDVPSKFPGDATATSRDFSYGRVLGFDEFSSNQVLSYVDRYGGYSNLPVQSLGYTLGEVSNPGYWHVANMVSSNVCAGVIANNSVAFTFGGNAVIPLPAQNDTTLARHDGYALGWSAYIYDMMAGYFGQVAETPANVYQWVGPGSGGFTSQCSETDFAITARGGDDSDLATDALGRVVAHELLHPVLSCTQRPGSSCNPTAGPGLGMGGPSVDEGVAERFGDWFMLDFDATAYGPQLRDRAFRYAGPNVSGDSFLHPNELLARPLNAASLGCTPAPGGVYDCAANEACVQWTEGKPGCVLRGVSRSACQTMFAGTQPSHLLFAYADGRDQFNNVVSVCKPDTHLNGGLFMDLTDQIMHSAGFWRGFGASLWTFKGMLASRTFTQGYDTHHSAYARWAGDYEASDAFRDLSKESFARFDDVTNEWTRAEMVRPVNVGTNTFTTGPDANQWLAFQPLSYSPGTIVDDPEWITVPVTPGATYTITASTTSLNVDLCMYVYSWPTGSWVGSSPGCFDGNGVPNAAINVTANAPFLLVYVTNLLRLQGVYQISVTATGDDLPDTLTQTEAVHPLRSNFYVGESGMAATINTTSDRDIFRYDVPVGQSGAVTFSLGTLSAPIELYQTTGTTAPSGSPLATGTGSLTFNPTPGSHLYYRVGPTSTLGAYTASLSQIGCSACNENGTLAAPRPLPSNNGGTVFSRMDNGIGSPPQCENGTSCDWYSISLAANERFTAVLHGEQDSLCALELSVISSSLGYYVASNGNAGSSAERMPIVRDELGSLDSTGASVTFAATRPGTYLLRVRPTSNWNCNRYYLTVARGGTDGNQPTPIH